MALYLDVPYYPQTSSMSCWWAAIRMALGYARQSAPEKPEGFSPAFRDRRPAAVLNDPGRRAITLPRPGEWFQTGVPPMSIMFDSSALEPLFDPTRGRIRGGSPRNQSLLLSRIDQRIVGSGFRHTISPSLREIMRFTSVAAPGSWSARSLESMLRTHGPIVQFSTMSSGSGGGYGHAFVIVGAGPTEACIHDSAQMSWLPVSYSWLNGVITNLRRDLFSPSVAMPLLAHSHGGRMNRTLAAPRTQGS